ncbi:hypothetical protein ACHAPT_008309 [Fusarium lateritium]
MRPVLQALQLLAFCHLASASRCRPNSSSATSILSESTAKSSSTESAPSTTVSSTTLSVETDSSTTLSYSTSTLEESSSTGQSFTSSTASTATSEANSVTSGSSTVSTTLVTTSSAEPSTTTSTSISQGPSNLIVNPGWENKDTIAPWEQYGDFGSVSLSTSEFYEGSQSGYFTGVAGGPANMGFKQPINPSLITVGKEYKFSVYVKLMSSSGCFARFVACGSGNAYFNSAGIGGAASEWTLATVSCTWSQASWEAGPNIQVRGVCERLSWYIDDAVLEEVKAS